MRTTDTEDTDLTMPTMDQVRQLALDLFRPNVIKFFSAPDHKVELFIEFVSSLNDTGQKNLKKFHNANLSILGKGRGGHGWKKFAENYQQLINRLQYQVREELIESKAPLTSDNIDNRCAILVGRDKDGCFSKMQKILLREEFLNITFKLHNNLAILIQLADDLNKFVSKKQKSLSDLLEAFNPDSKKIDQEPTGLPKKDVLMVKKTRGFYQSGLSVSFITPHATSEGLQFTPEEKMVILRLQKALDVINNPIAWLSQLGYSSEAINGFSDKMDSVMKAIFEPKIVRLLFASYKDLQLFGEYFNGLDPKFLALFNIFDNPQFNILYGNSPFVEKFQSAISDLAVVARTAFLDQKKPYTEEDIGKSIEEQLLDDIAECKSTLEIELGRILIKSPVLFATLLSHLDNLRKLADHFDKFSTPRIKSSSNSSTISAQSKKKLTNSEKFLLEDIRKNIKMEVKQQKKYLLGRGHQENTLDKLNQKIELVVDSILEIEFFKTLYSLCRNISTSPIKDKVFAQSFCDLYERLREKASNKLSKEGKETITVKDIDWEMEDLLDGDENGASQATQNALKNILILAEDNVLELLLGYAEKRAQLAISSSSVTMMPAPSVKENKPASGAASVKQLPASTYKV